MNRLTDADHCYWSASWRPPVDLWRWDHWFHCSTQYPSSHQQDALRPFRIYQHVDVGDWPPSGFRRWSMSHHYWWAPQTSCNFIFPPLAISNQFTVIFYLFVFLYRDQSFTQFRGYSSLPWLSLLRPCPIIRGSNRLCICRLPQRQTLILRSLPSLSRWWRAFRWYR